MARILYGRCNILRSFRRYFFMEDSEKLSKKEKRELVENNLLARVYDLILNEQTSEEERSSLVEFKNAIESGKDFQLETMKLAETLRQLALRKFKNKEKLSDEVSKFYMDISTTGLFEKNLAIGLCATKLWFQ